MCLCVIMQCTDAASTERWLLYNDDDDDDSLINAHHSLSLLLFSYDNKSLSFLFQ